MAAQDATPRHDKITARCDACGHNWKLNRGDRFLCPYCQNEPEVANFSGSFAVLPDKESQRWMR